MKESNPIAIKSLIVSPAYPPAQLSPPSTRLISIQYWRVDQAGLYHPFIQNFTWRSILHRNYKTMSFGTISISITFMAIMERERDVNKVFVWDHSVNKFYDLLIISFNLILLSFIFAIKQALPRHTCTFKFVQVVSIYGSDLHFHRKQVSMAIANT